MTSVLGKPNGAFEGSAGSCEMSDCNADGKAGARMKVISSTPAPWLGIPVTDAQPAAERTRDSLLEKPPDATASLLDSY